MRNPVIYLKNYISMGKPLLYLKNYFDRKDKKSLIVVDIKSNEIDKQCDLIMEIRHSQIRVPYNLMVQFYYYMVNKGVNENTKIMLNPGTIETEMIIKDISQEITWWNPMMEAYSTTLFTTTTWGDFKSQLEKVGIGR